MSAASCGRNGCTWLIDRWISRSRPPAFVEAATTIRKHRHGTVATLRLGINNARAERD